MEDIERLPDIPSLTRKGKERVINDITPDMSISKVNQSYPSSSKIPEDQNMIWTSTSTENNVTKLTETTPQKKNPLLKKKNRVMKKFHLRKPENPIEASMPYHTSSTTSSQTINAPLFETENVSSATNRDISIAIVRRGGTTLTVAERNQWTENNLRNQTTDPRNRKESSPRRRRNL